MGYVTDHNRACISQPFALKYHRAHKDHLDLHLCNHELAVSLALYKIPSNCPDVECGAIQVEDHLRENLGFEGVHPEGRGAGPVIVVDQGIWQPLPEYADITASLREGRIKFAFRNSNLLQGLWSLTRQKSCFRPQNPLWILKKESDIHALRRDQVKPMEWAKLRSCLTGLTLEETERNWHLGKRRFRAGGSLFAPSRLVDLKIRKIKER